MHANGAWGSYFASMISDKLRGETLWELFPNEYPKPPDDFDDTEDTRESEVEIFDDRILTKRVSVGPGFLLHCLTLYL